MAANVKMGADIGSFKQGLQQAKNEVRTLDQEMKKIDATFKATGNAEQAMNQKTDALNKKMEKQREAARQAEAALKAMTEAGVKPTSDAYQKMTREMLAAETGMMETQAALNDLGNNAKKAADSVGSLETGLNGISKKISLEQVRSGIAGITTGLEAAAKKAAQLGVAIWENITDVARFSDDTATQAMMLNMGVEDYQRYKKVFDTVGEITVQEWDKAKRKIQTAMVNSTDDQKTILAALGLTEVNGGKDSNQVRILAQSWEDLFWDAGRALKEKVQNGQLDQDTADVYATALYGKGYSQLRNLLELGKEGFADALAEQNVATDEAIKKNAEFNDKLIKLQGDFESLQAEVMSGLAPALSAAADSLDSLMGKMLEYLQTPEGKQALKDMETAVSGLFKDLGDIDPEAVVSGFTDVFNTVIRSIKWLVDNKDGVVAALEGIVIGWGTLKLTGAALDIITMINGLNGLGGGVAQAAGTAAGASWGAGFAGAVLKAAPWLIGAYVLGKPSTAKADTVFTPEEEKRYNAEHWMEILGQRMQLELNRKKEAAAEMADSVWGWLNGEKTGGPQIRMELPGAGVDRALSWWNQRSGSGTHTLWKAEHGGGGRSFAVTVDPVPDVELLQEQLNRTTVHVPAVIDWTANESWAWRVGSGGYIRDIPGGIGTGAVMPSMRANGLPYVPYDGYLAMLHKGERVMTARENTYNNSSNLYVEKMVMNNGLDAQTLVSEMNAQARRTQRGFGN